MPRRPTTTSPEDEDPTFNIPLAVYQGDDKRWVFKLSQEDGQPLRLAGYTAAVQFRLDAADYALTAIDAVTEVTDPDNGEVSVLLASEQSRLLTESLYYWDMEVTDVGASWTTTMLGGTLAVTPEITRVV